MKKKNYDIPSGISQEHYQIIENIDNLEDILGTGLIIPYAYNNSGQRVQMVNNQTSQTLEAINPHYPILSTGNETKYGEFASSYLLANTTYQVIAILNKYGSDNKIHYYLIVKDIERLDCEYYDIIERVEARNTGEMYGYTINNSYLDRLKVGSIIDKGDVYSTSSSHVDGLRCNGVNLLTAYVQKNGNEEDAIIISESGIKKLGYRLVHKIHVTINENDIPLNLYGDDNNYKVIPDTGEYIKDSTLIGIRRVVNNDLLYSQSNHNLKRIQSSDEIYYINGKVVDIKVMSNNNDVLNTEYFAQLKKYTNYSNEFHRSLVSAVDTHIKTSDNYKMSYELSKLYNISSKILEGTTILYNDKKFNNIVVEFLIVEENICNQADKMSDRYGGKGEISKIVPDNEMPRTEDGRVIDVLLNPSSIIKRQNLGTIIEPTINMLSNKLMKCCKVLYLAEISCVDKELTHIAPTSHEELKHKLEVLDMIGESFIRYIFIFNDVQSNMLREAWTSFDLIEPKLAYTRKCEFLENNFFDMENIYMVISSDKSMDIKTLDKIIDEFKYITSSILGVDVELEEYMYYNEIDSRGNPIVRRSSRPITIGEKYMFIMKQLGSIDHAAVSASSIGQKGDNIKSSEKKKYKSPIKSTPIRFGEMEIMNLIHLGDVLNDMMLLYSSSIQGRRSLENALLQDDIFTFSLKIAPEFKNRAVEILNSYMTSMGIRLSVVHDDEDLYEFYSYIDKDIFDPNADYDDELNVFNYLRHNPNIITDVFGSATYIDNKFISEYGWFSREMTDEEKKKGCKIIDGKRYFESSGKKRDKLDKESDLHEEDISNS